MLSPKKTEKTKWDHSGRNLAQYGLFDVSADFNLNSGVDNDNGGDDSDLEAELAALAGSGSTKPKRPAKKVVHEKNLDAMVAASMRDIASDEELSGDDDDPDLLNELNNIAGDDEGEKPEEKPVATLTMSQGSTDIFKLLNDRLKMYEEAEKNAKAVGESSRARRFNRGFKTIKDLLKQANSDKAINNDDIPPEVTIAPSKPATVDSSAEPQPIRPAPPIPPKADSERQPPEETPSETLPSITVDVQLVNMLVERQKQYKISALNAKKCGDTATAVNYIKIAKQFEAVITAARNGQAVDLSRMPEPPGPTPEKIGANKTQNDNIPQITVPEGVIPEETLIVASSVEEALEQRLEVYKKQEQSAKEQDNASKARRMGRVVKQYEEAIKAHEAGKPISVEDLPTPPGYGPIPAAGGETPKPTPDPPAPSPAKPTTIPKNQPSTSKTTRLTGNQAPNSRAEKQLILLLAKQKQFKEAALNAKRKGEIDQAKEFLRTAKGFDPLIEAASCGLPVDLSTLPISPDAKSQLDNEYVIVMSEECTEKDDANVDVITRLESQLTRQLKMCLSTRDHHKALGDVAGTNRFEKLALHVTKDLDLVRLARRTRGAGVPKFHYETKDFSIVKSFTELADNDLELTIVRGISYTTSITKDIDTYVKFEFPFPQEEPFVERTSTVKDTNSPEYNSTFTIPIQRTARACQRVFKRHAVKFEVYSKGGFFRGDTLMGTAIVKLQPLETQCELHDSFDLIEGRKKVGGKLEVKLRLRHPIVSQQVEQLHEKWLVIDS